MSTSTMKAVVVTRPGGPEVLELRDVPRPEPGEGEVRVRVASSGVNRADLLQRLGGYPAPTGWPQEIPGLEFAGVVDAVGPGVGEGALDARSGDTAYGAGDGMAVGDAVMGIVGGGGYAEYVVTDARAVVPVPRGLDPVEAGAIPEVFMTAFDAAFLQCGLEAGETLLIHAVGSGVGTAALQMARAWGVTTVGTSRTPEKLERAIGMDLDHAVLGGADRDWPEDVLDATGGRGADVILDLVGGPYVAGNLAALAERGRWIVVGVPGGATADFDLRGLMRKRASVTGTVLRARPIEEKIELARAFESRVIPLFEEGEATPVIDRTFAPNQAPDAHRRMEENRNFGKLLLVW